MKIWATISTILEFIGVKINSMHIIYDIKAWTILGTFFTLIGVIIALKHLYIIIREIRRSYSPILLIEPLIGVDPPIKFSQVVKEYPVVQSVNFKLRNNGNGPALNIKIKVRQGKLELERKIHPSYLQEDIFPGELERSSLAKGEMLKCLFRAKAGFPLPKENSPLLIDVTCENIYKQKMKFFFEAPTDTLSALSEKSQALSFKKVKGL